MNAPRPSRGRIVFSHANGFPAGTYRILFEAWRKAGFEVDAIEKLGHDPCFPVTDNWPHLRDQLIHFIETGDAGPAFLVGHSLGGFLSVLAASKRPDLARAIVLLDSPIVGGWKARALQFAKATGIGERLSPGHVSRRRRQYWSSPAAAHAHFAAKAVFARWAPGALADYIASGIEPAPQHEDSTPGYRLAFERGIETAIYNGLPHHLTRLLRAQPLRCPVALIRGSDSTEVRRAGLAATNRLTDGRISIIEGTHLFPLERPLETAAEVARWLAAFSTPHADR